MPLSLPGVALRRAVALVLAAVCLLVACEPQPAAAPSPSGSSVSASHQLVNRARNDHGLSSLPRASALDRKAQSHAEWMAANNRLAHSDLDAGVPAGWSKLAENVGAGSSAEAVHHQFMSSTAHRGHILDRSFGDIGVGAARAADGTLYIAQVFRG